MSFLEKTLRDQDVLLVLGGEGEEKGRTLQAYHAYIFLKEDPQIILTGDKIFPSNEEPHAIKMRDYLRSLRVEEDKLTTETKARDTLGQIYFTQPIMEQMLSGNIKKRIGLVTDHYHMKRGLWTAKNMINSNYEIQPIPTKNKGTKLQQIKEKIIMTAWVRDMKKYNIDLNNRESATHYMNEIHPLHAQNPPPSLYKKLVDLSRLHERIKN